MDDVQTVALLVGIVSPIYAILVWRMKVSMRIEKKIVKIITFLKLEHPEKANVFD